MATELEHFQKTRIEALEQEILRLNDEINKLKSVALKARISDPIFLKPISEINVDYEIIKNE